MAQRPETTILNMMDDEYLLRAATASDQAFLFEMLVEAANWHPDRSLGPAAVAADPELFHYVDGWQRIDDLGVVAESAGRPIGAAWLRYFNSEEPGYGYVADDVPELSIGLVAEWRGGGVGRALLREMIDQARAVGVSAICLSVERANFAHRLYEHEGFVVVAEGADADTMVRDLWPTSKARDRSD